MPATSKPDRLNSWKAIANYLGRSERTARRWETEEGLPVHRQMHQASASVYAYVSEIDAWQTRDESSGPTPPDSPVHVPALLASTEQASIGVLPFSFVGSDPGDEYIADGFTDEVIADLSKVHSLRVISRTSSMSLKGTTADAPTLARQLGVSHLLEGSVRRHDSGVRISVRLIDAASDRPTWAEKYAGSVDDVFDIQERIAREVTQALELHLTSEEDQRLTERAIDSWPVWQSVVQARQESLRWNREAIDNAVRLLSRSLTLAGDNAYLYAALGRAHLQYRETGMDLGSGPLEQAELYVARCFETDPGCAAGLQLRGWLHYSRGEIQLAVNDLKASLEIDRVDPDPIGVLCNCYLISGQMAQARAAIERLLSLDPLTPLFSVLPAWADTLEGNCSAAVEAYRKMLGREPASPMARLFLVWILAINEQFAEVVEVAGGFAASDADSLPAQLSAQFVAACQGVEADTRISVHEEALAANDLFPRMFAQAYALAGNIDEALRWLSTAVDRGFINFPYLDQHDPILTRLKGEPRYDRLLEEVGKRWQAFEP